MYNTKRTYIYIYVCVYRDIHDPNDIISFFIFSCEFLIHFFPFKDGWMQANIFASDFDSRCYKGVRVFCWTRPKQSRCAALKSSLLITPLRWLESGCMIVPLPPGLKHLYQKGNKHAINHYLRCTAGAVVSSVVPGGPAEQVLQVGDFIVCIQAAICDDISFAVSCSGWNYSCVYWKFEVKIIFEEEETKEPLNKNLSANSTSQWLLLQVALQCNSFNLCIPPPFLHANFPFLTLFFHCCIVL